LMVLNCFLLVGMDLVEPGNTFLFTGTVVQYIGTGIQTTGISPEESQTANKGIGSDLKCQGRKWLAHIRLTGYFLASIWIYTYNCLLIHSRGQISTNRIQQKLDTFILKGRTAHHRDNTHIHYGSP